MHSSLGRGITETELTLGGGGGVCVWEGSLYGTPLDGGVRHEGITVWNPLYGGTCMEPLPLLLARLTYTCKNISIYIRRLWEKQT